MIKLFHPKRIILITPLGIFVIEKCSNPKLYLMQIINFYQKKKKKKELLSTRMLKGPFS